MVCGKKIIFMLFVFIYTNIFSTKKIINLQNAFDKHIITAKAICTGGLELDYLITNLSNDSLSILLPVGWRFNSNAQKNNYQDVFVTENQLFTLKAKQQKCYHLVGFCCEAHQAGPIKNVPYTNGKLADTNLVLLARYLNKKQFDYNTQQQAIWAISDNEATANITSNNDTVAQNLRQFVALLKNEPLPWYTLQKRARVSVYGDVINKPIQFTANIGIPSAVSNVCYAYCFIVDENNKIVSRIVGQWIGPMDDGLKTNFKIDDLKNGTYKLVLETNKSPIFEKAFKI